MNRSWAISILGLVCVVACAPAEEGEDVLGGQRNASGGVRSSGASGGSKSSSSSGGERTNASGGASAGFGSGGLGSGGATALATSGGVAGGFSAPNASGGLGAGGAILLTSGGAGNGPTLVFGNGSGGVVFATGGVRNGAGAPQAGSTASDPNSDTHIDLNGDASTEFEPSSGDLGGGGVRTTIDWGP